MSLESISVAGALGAYFLAGAAAIAALGLRRRLDGAVLALLALAIALLTAALGLRWARIGHGPFITMHEILASNIWSLSLVYLAAAWRWSVLRPAAAVVMPILFVMMAWMLATDPAPGHLPATYATIWLWVHVALGKIFLGAVLVAVGLAGIVLLRSAGVRNAVLEALPEDGRLERLAFRFMVVGFLFQSLMLVAGAIWAQDAWGRYWAWDPLETWAFVTWLSLAAFLHARVTFVVRPSAGALMILGVFTLAFLTFFGVPFVTTAPHKGAI